MEIGGCYAVVVSGQAAFFCGNDGSADGESVSDRRARIRKERYPGVFIFFIVAVTNNPLACFVCGGSVASQGQR